MGLSERGSYRLRDGGSIAFEIHGDDPGTPLLLMRPAAGAASIWSAFRDELASRLRVIAFDPRGIGESSPARPWTTTRTMAEDALELLSDLGVSRCHVFGISLGGMVATRLAIDQPHRVERLVLAATLARGLPPGVGATLEAARLATCLLAPPSHVQQCLARRIAPRSAPPRGAQPPGTGAAPLDGELPARRPGMFIHAVAALRHDVRHELGQIRCPTLVIAGASDRLTPPAAVGRLAQAIPKARFKLIDAGHWLTLERPHECAQMVVRFVTGKGNGAEKSARSHWSTPWPPS
jgi:3-oxoadipate enol-lactonase